MALVKYNNNSLSAITSTGLSAGAMTLIKSQTASSSSTISFVHGSSDVILNNTYPIYLFKWISVHPSANDVAFTFNGSIDAGSNYNVTKQTAMYYAYHEEGGGTATLAYGGAEDLAQSTSFCRVNFNVGSDADEEAGGELWLFNPSSTTHVKNFVARTWTQRQDNTLDNHIAGYFNDTNDIDAIQFKPESGTFDVGTFKLYGIKDS